MRIITYTCDRCGKNIQSSAATKINTTLFRGMDSSEKKNYDFCSKCFLKMKKAWQHELSVINKKPAAEGKQVPDKLPTQTKPVSDKLPVMTEEMKDAPKKRGRKPKPVDVNEWKTRTETVYGVIKPWEKELILKFHVEDGMTAEEIGLKLHRIPKGVNRTITAAAKSGELDRLKKELKDKEPGKNISEVDIFDRNRKSSYIMPSNKKIIDGVKYDIGSIMALHKAGWTANKIAEENLNWDEDIIRIIIEKQEGK